MAISKSGEREFEDLTIASIRQCVRVDVRNADAGQERDRQFLINPMGPRFEDVNHVVEKKLKE
eukprot:518952-Heterocapsa_arctica.AAC.1